MIVAAFIAGLLMFLAPCTLPLVPGYLAFISAAPSEVLTKEGERNRRKVFINALAFVVGFSIVFILLGTFTAFIATFLGAWRDVLARAAGGIIILFGLTMLGVVRIPVLSSEKHLRLPHFLTIGRPESSFLIGALFALGWSPCIGPILGSILLLASASSTALQGAFLLGVFSLGLGVPFILTALLLSEAGEVFARLGFFTTMLQRAGGVLLIFIGILLLTGQMGLLVTYGFGIFSGYNGLLQYM
jgi:cytochrome c-type biogenesis protein